MSSLSFLNIQFTLKIKLEKIVFEIFLYINLDLSKFNFWTSFLNSFVALVYLYYLTINILYYGVLYKTSNGLCNPRVLKQKNICQ